jgi:hypothetical protein
LHPITAYPFISWIFMDGEEYYAILKPKYFAFALRIVLGYYVNAPDGIRLFVIYVRNDVFCEDRPYYPNI